MNEFIAATIVEKLRIKVHRHLGDTGPNAGKFRVELEPIILDPHEFFALDELGHEVQA
jgi:hypothetical protein